jgi:kinesin family member 22
MVVIHGNRIIEIEWAFKNNRDYVPSPKPPRKSKNKKRAKSNLGREGMQVDRGGGSEAVGFGTELTNAESPVGSKRRLADTESTTPKRQKQMNIATPVVNVSSDDECGPPAVVKKARREAVV